MAGANAGLVASDLIALQPAWLDDPNRVQREVTSGVARRLHRPAGGPGYAVIKATGLDIDLETIRDFQVSLMRAVWLEMESHRWIRYRSDQVRLNKFEATDGLLPREVVGDVVTFKRLHFDPYSLIFCHLYEPPDNLAGGTVALVDVRTYLHETGWTLADAFEPLHAPGHNGRLVAREDHRLRMLGMYARTFPPPTSGELLLLIVRNDPDAGVAHEIGQVDVVDPTAPTRRRFYRTSYAPHH